MFFRVIQGHIRKERQFNSKDRQLLVYGLQCIVYQADILSTD